MQKINTGRVILGGLVAGVIINVVEGVVNGLIFKDQWADAMKALGKLGTMSTKQIVAFNSWGFAAGILAVWLYAAIRPRFGAGAATAVRAGAVVWLLAVAMANAMGTFLHLYPLGLVLTITAIELVEVIVATLAGACIYKEEGAAPA